MKGNHGRSQIISGLCLAVLLWAGALPIVREPAHADDGRGAVARARLSTPNRTGTLADIEYAGLKLDGGSELMVVSPQGWRDSADLLLKTLESTHAKYVDLFGAIPKFSITVRLMEEETFYLSTGAPRWTNAMFFKGQIIIPVAAGGKMDQDNLFRSIRHEYTHAVIHALSAGACPGWIDEGLAQWAEGDVNPLLTQALSEWLSEHPPVPMKLLQGGFTKLPSAMVPAAYAESLLATRQLLQNAGIPGFRLMFELLRKGVEPSKAFRIAFGKNEKEFEREFKRALPDLIQDQRIAILLDTTS